MKIVSGAQMAAIDRRSIEECFIDGQLLMENAGRAVVRVIREQLPQARKLCVLCGPGNNGGDGLVVARNWHNLGFLVDVFTLSDSPYRDDAGLNSRRLSAAGLPLHNQLPSDFNSYDVVVDALFGTGLCRPLNGKAAQVVASLNTCRVPIIAVDIPSGVDSESGAILGCAVRAAHTITFGLPKLGHYLEPGAQLRGQLFVEEIGFPRTFLEKAPGGTLVDFQEARSLLPRRASTAHKGSSGRAILWAGSQAYPGAACLCARGALRAGAGLVYLVAPAQVSNLALHHLPELIPIPLDGGAEASRLEDLLTSLSGTRALCIGPGFGSGERLQEVAKLLEKAEHLPALLIDADALRALPSTLLPPTTILTPHHGEIARMLKVSVADVEADRLGAARQAARIWGCLVVLKGAPTLISDANGEYWVNANGHPVLAQGGTGDVLSGVITALLAQGIPPHQAAPLGVWLHGRAGQRKASAIADRGVVAHEIADEIPRVIGELQAKVNQSRQRIRAR